MRKGLFTMKNDLYLVTSPGGRKLHVRATNGSSAKRAFCKAYGIKPNDYFCGVPALSAHKMKPDEVAAWESDEPAHRATLLFIHGMLEIEAEAFKQRTAE